MTKRKEYRVHRRGGLQGHYLITKTKKQAISRVAKKQGYPQKNYQATLWKVDGKHTPYARRKMG